MTIFIPKITDKKRGFLTGKGIVMSDDDAKRLEAKKLGTAKKVDGRKVKNKDK
jgi:hypothetical protein